MRRALVLLCFALAIALFLHPSGSNAAASVYRCDAFGYQLTIPAGWKVLTKDCTGNKTPLLQSTDATGAIVMEAVAEDKALYFPDLVHTALAEVGSSGSNLTYDTLHIGGQTYSTATDTFTVSGTSTKLAAYFLAVKHSGVLQVFSALVRVNDNPQATTELVAAQASLTGIHLFNGPVDNRILYRTILLAVVALALLVGSAVLLRRRLATSGQLVSRLFAGAIVMTVVSYFVTSWPIAGLDLAVKVAFLGNLLAWPILALISRLRAPAEPEWPAPSGL